MSRLGFKSVFLFILLLGVLGTLFSGVYAFDVTITDLVGEPIGVNTDINLPTEIKANSDWVPLYKITISTTSGYTLNVATITIVRQNTGFSAASDLLAPGSGLTLFKDDGDAKWEGVTIESACSAAYSPAVWTENPVGSWSEKVTISTNNSITAGNNYFYLAIKTANIGNGDQFGAVFNATGKLVLEFNDGSIRSANYGAADTLTADTVSPTVLDSDNDGETDDYEKFSGSDWLDPASNSGNNYLWPKNGEKVSSATFVTAHLSKINLWIDDPYQGSSAVSAPDVNNSTVTVSGIAGTFVFGANNLPYPKTVLTNDGALGTYAKYDRITCQLPVTLASDGSNDGTYTVTINPVDNLGNAGTTVTRTFIYDTQGPIISTVTAPTTGNTTTALTFTVNANDSNGMPPGNDVVQLHLLDSAFVSLETNNVALTTTAGQYSYSAVYNTAGSYYYYFTAKDYANNVSTYPVNADVNPNQAIGLVLSDTSGPWVVIANDTGGAGQSKAGESSSYIKTLVNIPNAGITVNYNYASNPAVDKIPTVYSANNNLLQATVEDDAVGAKFQSKLSTATAWTDLTTISLPTNQVWEATWDTTGLATELYDIRVIAWDLAGNTSTPTVVASPGWVQVKLNSALEPEATIDQTKNDLKVGDGKKVRDFLVLCAAPSASGNVDFSSITFQYRPSGASSWTDIATDSDPTNNTPLNVTFKLDYADLPLITQNQSAAGTDIVIDTAAISRVQFDCITSDTYDKEMAGVSDGWQVTIPFPTGTYDYRYAITYNDNSTVNIRDPREQDNDGVVTNSRIIIAAYTALWNISSLATGSYHLRAVAKDTRGLADSDPASITVIVDTTAPTAVTITQPAASGRLRTGVANALYANVSADDMDNGRVFFLYSFNGTLWSRVAAADTNKNGGWTQNWTPAATISNDVNAWLRAYALDEAGNIRASEAIPVTLDATNPKIVDFSINGSTDTEMDLNYGTLYSWSVTTKDTDIDNLTFTTGLNTRYYSWSPNSKVSSYTTASDTYIFQGTLLIAVDPANDNQAEAITATLTDKSGRTVAVVKTVNLKDVTPSAATLGEADGFEVRAGEKIKTADRFIQLRGDLDTDDDGITKWQYRPAGTTNWITWLEDTTPNNGERKVFPDAGNLVITLADGDYDLRILCVDDDNNPDPNPATVTITVDSSEPDIKPAAIISLSAAGTLTAVEYDELVDGVQFEYRVAGSTAAWIYIGFDNVADSTFGGAGNTWSVSLAALPAEKTYEIRAIAYYTAGPAKADPAETPLANVEIKRNAVGTKTYVLSPEQRLTVALADSLFRSAYLGAEQTFTSTLNIVATQSLTKVNARLLLNGTGASDIDRYLTVSGSTTTWTAVLDISELTVGGVGRIVINATDASGNKISASLPIGLAAVSWWPGGGLIVGRVTVDGWANPLENRSALAVLPATNPTTPSTQATLITAVGEPWEFLLSEPQAFKLTNNCGFTFAYNDVELNGAHESKLGVAYWDAAKNRWSAEGITTVTRDTVNNTVTFDTNHFSRFSLAVIDSQPTVTFISPQSGSYAGSDPIIEANLSDSFSAIRDVRVDVDGVDQTNNLMIAARTDGIDNNNNGLIDEGEGTVVQNMEEPLNQSSATSAKYRVRAPFHLSDGQHTIKMTATNEEGISSEQSAQFTAGAALDILNAFAKPNPFDPAALSGNGSTIDFTLTDTADKVTIKVYDFSGHQVYTREYNAPLDGHIDGQITWNGHDDDNRLLANGVYFMKIEAEGRGAKTSKTIKVAVLK